MQFPDKKKLKNYVHFQRFSDVSFSQVDFNRNKCQRISWLPRVHDNSKRKFVNFEQKDRSNRKLGIIDLLTLISPIVSSQPQIVYTYHRATRILAPGEGKDWKRPWSTLSFSPLVESPRAFAKDAGCTGWKVI